MSRLRARWTILATLLLLAGAAAATAAGAETTFEELGRGMLTPSAQPGLLAPISESGRTGWDCVPEKAAAAKKARAAELPPGDR